MNKFEFYEYECKVSFEHQELLALIQTLENQEIYLFFGELQSRCVYWQIDSKNNHIFMKRGSRQPRIQADVFKFKTLEKRLNLEVILVWE